MSENVRTSANRSPSAETADSEVSAVRRPIEWLANRNSFAVIGVLLSLGFAADHFGLPDPMDSILFLTAGVLSLVLATVSTTDTAGQKTSNEFRPSVGRIASRISVRQYEDGYDHDLSDWTRAKVIAAQLVWAITPWGLFTQCLQVGGTAVAYIRHRGRPPNRTRQTPTTEFSAPVEGEWLVTNGGVTKPTSHS